MAILKVGADGKAPSNAKVGDTIVTAGGNFTITGGSNGSFTSVKGAKAPTGGNGGGSSNGTWGANNPNQSSSNAATPDYSAIMYDPNSSYKQKQDAYNSRLSKEMGMRANGTWNDSWATTESFAPLFQAPVDLNAQAAQVYEQKLMQNNDFGAQMYRDVVNQGANRLNAQKSDINASYEDTSRQAYIAHMQAQKQMPQQMAALGMTGGASESSLVGAQSSYESGLNNTANAKQKALSDIDLAIADLQASGDIQAAQYILNNADKIADNYVQSLYADISRNDANAQNDRAFGFQKMQYGDEMAYRDKVFAQNAQGDAQSKAIQMASLGYSAEEIAMLLGMPIDQARIYASRALQQMNSSGGGGGGAGRRSSGSGKLSAAPDVSFGDNAPTVNRDAPNKSIYDHASVLALGYGPLDSASLDKLINSGTVGYKVENGKIIVFKKETPQAATPKAPQPKAAELPTWFFGK